MAHVLVIPVSGSGHVNPMLGLAKRLARNGITTTLVCFNTDISADSSSELQGLRIRLVSLDNPLYDEADLQFANASKLRKAFEPWMEKLVHDKRSGIAGPTCILSDMFLPWTQDLAEKLQIPRYMLVTSGVIFAKVMQGFAHLFGHRLVLSEAHDSIVKFDGSVCIPGLFPLRYHELPSGIRDFYSEFMLMCKSLWRAKGVLANSFYELEEQMIETWKLPGPSGFEHTKVPKIYPVGPFFSTTVTVPGTDIKILHGLENSAEKSLLWLGFQPSSSVLYVAFGSQFRLSAEDIIELALGLEDSNQRFLWVLPLSKDSSEEKASITDFLPPGFEARIGHHGCIVTGWVPQLQILAHSATAAFLTHSGWNSTLESIMMGVPMISWPLSAEQHLNCRYVVDHLKIASEIQTGPEQLSDRKEVERAIRLVMVESEGKAMRRQVQDFQIKGAVAVAEGGSTSRIFQEFVDDIKLQ